MSPADRGRIADRVRRRLGYRFPRVGARLAGHAMGLLPRQVDTELFRGIRVTLELDQPLQAAAFWTGERSERPTPKILRGWLAGAERFFDVGANFGFYSYLALSADPSVQVHSFEPQARLHELHRQVREANDLGDRFHPEPLALSDEPGRLTLRMPTDDLGHATFAPHPSHGAGDPTAEAEVVTFDGWRRDRGLALPAAPSWVLKMDIEGFEAHAIAGMSEALEARAFRGIVMELNEFTLGLCGSSVAEVRARLSLLGYEEDPALVKARGINGFFVPKP